ncbi:MAG: BTAD domain-containing putative transcriptional regulator [Gordonia sp. (in: high G+C Gram-positive bacteria)]
MREYRTLGPLSVMHAGTAVDLGSPKQRAVLAALLLARGGVVSADRLTDVLWGENPPAAAGTSLQAYISNLRRALRTGDGEASPIERVSPGYRLNPGDDRVDLTEFERLAADAHRARQDARWDDALRDSAAALELWRGDLLPEFGDEDWVSAPAAALGELRLGAAEIHVTALLAMGDVTAALTEISAQRAEDRLRERAVWLHMIALHRAGRTTEALEVFAEHDRALGDGLGLDPGAELRELQASILRHDPAIAAWPRPPHWTGAVSAREPERRVVEVDDGVRPAPPPPGPSLIGRGRLVAQIAALYDDESGTRWLALTGPAGIGKTRLAHEAARRARAAGHQVVWVRCPDAEGVPAWWPLRQLCRDLGADVDEVLSIPTGVDADTARFAVYERVQNLLEQSAAETPLTVVIDDVQWADAMSAGLLGYLTSVLAAPGLRLVLTVRSEESGPPVARLREAILRGGGQVCEVPPLRHGEVAELVRQVSDDDVPAELAAEIAERTGGNPLFATEYARLRAGERSAEIPEAVRSVLDRRLATLDPPVREVVGYAALLGEDVDIGLLARVMDRDPAQVADCLDEAADERIVVRAPVGGRPAFAHALLREQATATLAPLRRCRMHLRVADVLDGDDRPGAVEMRAAHLLDALPVADVEAVVRACRTAADGALARWDSENAAYWLECALRTYESLAGANAVPADRDLLLIDMLRAQARAGRAQLVLETVERRLSDAIDAGAADTAGLLARTVLRAGGGWSWISPTEEPGSLHLVLADAITAFDDHPAASVALLSALAVGHCYHTDESVPAELLARAERLAAEVGSPEVLADAAVGRLVTYSGVASRATELIGVAGSLAGLDYADAALDRVITDSVVAMADMTLGDLTSTQTRLRRAIAGSERMRLPVLRAQLRWMEMAVAVWHAGFDLAREHLRIAMAVHQQTELYIAGSGTLALMAAAGQQGVGDDLIDGALGTDGDWMGWVRGALHSASDNQVVRLLAAGVASIAWKHGDEALVHTMIDRWTAEETPMFWTSLAQATVLADLVVELGAVEKAPPFVTYLKPFAGGIATVGQVGCVGPVDLTLARLHYLCGDDADGDAALDRARRLCEDGGSASGVLRCRLLTASRGAPTPERDAELIAIARAADDLGLPRVAQEARDLCGGAAPSAIQAADKSGRRS